MARGLSPFQDADVRLETFDDLVSRTDRPERFAAFRKMLGDDDRDGTNLEEKVSWTVKEVEAARECLQEANIADRVAFEFMSRGFDRATSVAVARCRELTTNPKRRLSTNGASA